MVAKDMFPSATVTDSCEEVKFMKNFQEYGVLKTTSLRRKEKKNVDLVWKLHEINLFATSSHGWKREESLSNLCLWEHAYQNNNQIIFLSKPHKW